MADLNDSLGNLDDGIESLAKTVGETVADYRRLREQNIELIAALGVALDFLVKVVESDYVGEWAGAAAEVLPIIKKALGV